MGAESPSRQRQATRSRWNVRFAALLVVVVAAVVCPNPLTEVRAAQVAAEPGRSAPINVTSLIAPEVVEAGTAISIEARADRELGEVEVEVLNGYGRLSFVVAIVGGTGRLDLPSAVSQQAGVIMITSRGASATVMIEPTEVDEVVAPLVGPRTIVADGRDMTLAVVLPVDRYGNQVVDGTPVSVEWGQPTPFGEADDRTVVDARVEDGMVSTLLPSGEVAGATFVRTTAQTVNGLDVNSAVVRIDEVPGIVDGIVAVAAQTKGAADGRSLIEVQTTRLVDLFGNQLADGTLGRFIYDGPSGRGVVPGTVQNGVVRVEIVAPTVPGTIRGYFELHGRASNEVAVTFASAIASFEAHLERVGTDVVLRVSSVLDPDAAFVADGTEVQWGDHRTQIRRGTAEIRLPEDVVAAGSPPVWILGREQQPTRAPS